MDTPALVFGVALAEAISGVGDVATADTVTISDIASNIKALLDLDAGEFANVIDANRVTSLAANDGSIALDVNEAETLEAFDAETGQPLVVTAPSGTVTLSGTADAIMGMSPQQLGALSSIGVSAITVQGTSITLSVQQALALFDPVRISVLGGGSVIVAAETAADVASLTPAVLMELAAVGVNTIQAPTGAGPLTIDGGLTLSISGAVPANQTIIFAGTGGTLSLSDDVADTDVAGTIYGFSPPDTIDLTDVPYDNGATDTPGAELSTDPTNNNQPAIQITENGDTYYLDIDPSQVFPTGEQFNLTEDGGGTGAGTDLTVSEPTLVGSADLYALYPNSNQSVTVDGLVVGFQATLLADESWATVNRTIIQNGGELIADDGSTINDTFIESGGKLAVTDFSVTMNDTFIESGGLLDLVVSGADLGNINFGPAVGGIGGTLEIDDDNNRLVATIFGIAPGDTIDLTDVPYETDGNGTANFGFDPNDSQPAIVVNENGNTYYFDVDPAQNFTDDYFNLAPDSGGTGTDITVGVSQVTNFQEVKALEGPAGGALAYLWSNAANWTNGLPTPYAIVDVDILASGNPGGDDDIAALTLNRLTLTEGDIVISRSLNVVGNVVVGAAATASLTIAAGATFTANYVEIGADGQFNFDGGAVNINYFALDNNGAVTASGNEYIGTEPNANSFFGQGGGSNTITGALVLGDSSVATGTYDLEDGSLSATAEMVGFPGTGVFTQTGGTNTVAPADGGLTYVFDADAGFDYSVQDGALYVGTYIPGGTGTYDLEGGILNADAIYVSEGSLFKFDGGTANFNTFGLYAAATASGNEVIGTAANPNSIFTQYASQTSTASSNTIAGALVLGDSSVATGTYDLEDGSLSAIAEMVGFPGTGVFTQTGGTNTVAPADGGLTYVFDADAGFDYSVQDGALYVGTYIPGGTGTYDLEGGILNADTIYVSEGSLFKFDGGTANFNTFGLYAAATASGNEVIGTAANPNSIFTQYASQTSTASSNTISGALVLGDSSVATGTYDLEDGSLSATAEMVGFPGTGVFTQTGGTNTVAPADGGLTYVFDADAGFDYSVQDGALYVGTYIPGGTGTYDLEGGILNADAIYVSEGSLFKFDGGTANFNTFGLYAAATASGNEVIGTAANPNSIFTQYASQTSTASSNTIAAPWCSAIAASPPAPTIWKTAACRRLPRWSGFLAPACSRRPAAPTRSRRRTAA